MTSIPGHLACICLGLMLMSIPPSAGAHVTLAENGRTTYRIVVADDADAIAPEKTAAKELKTWLEQVTGARRLAAGVDWDALGKEGKVQKTVGATSYWPGAGRAARSMPCTASSRTPSGAGGGTARKATSRSGRHCGSRRSTRPTCRLSTTG